MTKADINWQIFNNSTDAYRDLKEGRVDAMFYVTGAGSLNLAQEVGMLAIPLDAATQKAGQDLNLGYYPIVWPKGQDGNTVDTPTLGSPNLVWANDKTTDDTAYVFVKAVFTHLDELQAQAGAAGFTKELAFAQSTFAYHPGAIKYFKEIGIWTAALDKMQADLIAKWAAVK